MWKQIIPACTVAAIAAQAPTFAAEPTVARSINESPLVFRASDFVQTASKLASVNVTVDPNILSDSDLNNVSAGESVNIGNITVAVTNQTLEATSSANTFNVGAMTSGRVEFGKNAFSGFNGVGNFVINTGNNNILQGSLSVTIVGTP